MAKLNQTNDDLLFRIAVIIMATVSCYTTTIGVQPMLGNWLISLSVAIALSLFLVAISFQMPQAFRDKRAGALIWGYTIVGLFSVLLNFNAIYGTFTAENLLYDELKNNREKLQSIQNTSNEVLAKHYRFLKSQKRLDSLNQEYNFELNNPRRLGHGSLAQEIYTQIPRAEADFKVAKDNYLPAKAKVDTLAIVTIEIIDKALKSKELYQYKQVVDISIDNYNEITHFVKSKLDKNKFGYDPEKLEFKNRDVGSLQHSLWSITNVFNMPPQQSISVFVSILLSILIDFIVLFVIVLINLPNVPNNLNQNRSTSINTPSWLKPRQNHDDKNELIKNRKE